MTTQKDKYSFVHQYNDFISLGGGHITAFLYCGKQPVLFDPGPSAFGPFYLEQIQKHVDRPEQLILALTHSHYDHCSAAPYLKRKIPGIRTAASLRATQVFQNPRAVEFIKRLNAEYEEEMAEELAGEDVTFDGLTVDRELSDSDSLELGGTTRCTVIETPGHTRDSLSYLFPDTGMLFTGDAAGVFEDGFMHSPYLSSYSDYISSLEEIISLRPAILCIGHNGILTQQVEQFLAEALETAKGHKNMVEAYLDEYNGDKEKVIARIAAEEYDAVPEHIQKRTPFLLSLEAKVEAIAKMNNGQ